MPQIETVHTPCLQCRDEFTKERVHYCRELLRYQRENYAQRADISVLEARLKDALQKLLKADRRYDELADFWQRMIDAERIKASPCTPA